MMQGTEKRVLVADDSQTMRMLLIFHLVRLLPGVKIIEVVNGANALEQLKQQTRT